MNLGVIKGIHELALVPLNIMYHYGDMLFHLMNSSHIHNTVSLFY